MTTYSALLVYPEGDTQEASGRLSINQIVDINGSPLRPPLPTVKMIAFRVYKISKNESRGEHVTSYHLELVRREEMLEYV
jgi:hypothetical protein